MAYMDQEKKAKIAPTVKEILTRYGVKGTLSVRNNMTLVLKIKSGPIDFINNHAETLAASAARYDDRHPKVNGDSYISVNEHWYHDHFTGASLAFLTEMVDAMNNGNHDRSDSQVDYFDVGWYTDLSIGTWNEPYALAT